MAPSPRLPPESVARSRYLPGSEVLALLHSGPDGLDPGEAARRLSLHGPNALALQPPVPAWRLLLGQFQSVVVLLLVVAMGVSGFFGEFLEAMAIGGVLVLNAGIGFFTEYRAHRAMEALVEIGRGEATVVRSGDARRIPTDQVVPGDVVLLESGEAIPADGRLLQTTEFQVNESALTGESVASSKDIQVIDKADSPLGDRHNMAYMNTGVTRGRGEMIVTTTGMGTEMGKIADLLNKTEADKTPLQKQLDKLTAIIAALAGLASAMQRYHTEQTPSTFVGAAASGPPGPPNSTVFPSQSPLDGATKHYNLSIQSAAAGTYELRAVPISGSAQAADKCGTLTFTSTGQRGITGGDTGVTWQDCWR